MGRRQWVSRVPRTSPRRGSSEVIRSIGLPPFVNGFRAWILSPHSGFSSRNRRPGIRFWVEANFNEPVDVQVEWRKTRPSPTSPGEPTYATLHTGFLSGGEHEVSPPLDLPYGSWWYRLRAGNSALGLWSPWTSTDRFLDIQPVMGSVSEYIEINVGVVRPLTSGAHAFIDMNVGRSAFSPLEGVAFLDLNVGVLPEWKLTASFLDLNVSPRLGSPSLTRPLDMNVTLGRPTPHIWWIRPEQGREGYVFHIFGQGFGSFQNEYDGYVLLGSLQCPVALWERVPQTAVVAEDHVIKRGLALDTDEITTEYGHIVVVVPVGAVSAMVKVVLEDV